MSKIPCIVQEVVTKTERITEHDIHIAMLKTGKTPRQPLRIRYRTGKDEYLALAGGFAWPGAEPGHAVVVGVQKLGDGYSYIALEEASEVDIPPLIMRAYDLYRKWGWNCGAIPWFWHGDPQTPYIDFLTKFNELIPKDKHWQRRFNLIPAAHYEDNKVHHWQILCRTLYALAVEEGVIKFKKGVSRIIDAWQVLDEKSMLKGKARDFPALAAYAYATVTLHERKPWLTPAAIQEALYPTAEKKPFEDQIMDLWGSGEPKPEPMEGYTNELMATVDS